jgi:RsiW-degrading membrane proteinase PrsW (M82 family)
MPTTLTLGRDPAADIIIGDPSISRRHAELVLLDDRRIFVRDLGGSNGTIRIRAGQRIQVQREIVAPGDEVSFGDVVLSFDALKEMMIDKLGGAADVGAGSGSGDGGVQDAIARAQADARDARDAADAAAHRASGNGSAGRSPGPGGSPGGSNASARSTDGPDSKPGMGVFVPIAGGGLARMRERGLLWPGLIFVIFVSRLSYLASSGEPEAMVSFTTEFALALVLLAFYVVYQLCGKAKPWTVILAVMAAEVGIMGLNGPLFTPIFGSATGAEAICWMSMHAGEVYNLPGQGQPKDKPQTQSPPAPGDEGAPKRMNLANVYIPAGAKVTPGVPVERPPFFSRLWAFTLNAGLKEELEKMIPVFLLIWAASASRRPDTKRWGVFEPLDAIVYACAAATAFIIVETLGGHGYVGGIIESARNTLDVAHRDQKVMSAAFMTLPLAILRTLDSLTGHLAYSGYFAYFVGLGLLRVKQRERLWIGGWLVAGVIHGFYDAAATSGDAATFAITLATFVAFFFLIAAILQARKLSPTREENFATRALPRERRA